MALSASESELLTETCQNMNQAANTCRDVLEMLRSLGSSGVVDIATHNNASDAHANVDSIAKINTSNNSFSIGKSGDVASGIFTGAPFRIAPTGTGSGKNTGPNSIQNMCESRGLSNLYPSIQSYFAETDANGTIAAFKNQPIGVWRLTYRGLNPGGTEVGRVAMIRAEHGTATGNTQFTFHVRISGSTEGAPTNAYLMDDTHFGPNSGATIDLGKAAAPFANAYLANAATVTSDRRAKKDISALGSQAVDFIKALRPVQFKMEARENRILESDEDGSPISVEAVSGVRTHWGLIAQEVKEALSSAGVEDAAVWCLSDKEDPNSPQALRYEELIAPLIKTVQVLVAKVEALEDK